MATNYLTSLIAKDLLTVLLQAQSRSQDPGEPLTPRQREAV